jgi:hypothetical protein
LDSVAVATIVLYLGGVTAVGAFMGLFFAVNYRRLGLQTLV